MVQIEFMPIDYDYFDWQGKNYALITGRTKEGKRALIIDSFLPYFWAILKDGTSEKKIKEICEKIEKIKIEASTRTTKVEKTESWDKKFLGKKVKAIKIFITNYKDAHPVADKIDFKEVEFRREYDLSYTTKYIIERGLVPNCWHKISGELLNNSSEFGGIDSGVEADICIKAEKIDKSGEKEFSPKILAYDIEADEFEIGRGHILMVSLAGKNFKKVLTWKSCPDKIDYVECFKNEAEMLEKFVEYVNKESPDFLVGYYSDRFDLPYLKMRAAENKVKLSLGLDKSQPKFTGGRNPSGKIFGISHIDIFRFIETDLSQYLQSETLSLNEVASELLGEKKLDFVFKKADSIKLHEWKDYFAYNLQDSVLTYKLAEKIWHDMVEFSKVIQEPLFDVSRDGMSQHVENYILHHLEKFDEIAEKRPVHDEIESRMERKKYEGAFVFQPEAGLYENLAVFDFTSFWPSIITSFNLSRTSLLAGKGKNSTEVDISKSKDFDDSQKSEISEVSGKNVYFSKEKGFFSLMLEEIIKLRKFHKQEYKKNENPLTKARSNAYKLLANASYGYQGFFGARYYCPEASAAATAIGREFIKKLIGKVNKESYKVIYADTDGVSFLLQRNTQKQTLGFLKKLNSELPGIMELELEDFYRRGLWVTKRTGEFGAKKKYALISEKGKIKIRGFETVRRDWCNLAREMQSKVIGMILKEGNEKKALEYVGGVIKDIKERKIKKEHIMIRTQLKKPISEYKAITPHVIAAGKMKEAGMPVDSGMLIEYFIAETRETKKLVREKVKLPDEKGEYNIKYYLGHQIIPAVENIFGVFNVNLREIADGKKQSKLGEF